MFGRKMPYLFGGTVTTQAHVLGDFRTLYLRSEQRLVDLLVRQAEGILNDTRSLGIELPQAKGPAFARLDLMNQHNLYYRNQIEIFIEEISNAALQYRHVLGWTPAQTPANP